MGSATVVEVDDVDGDLRAAMLRCWVDVSNAGGAVGFVPPVTAADVAPLLDAALAEQLAGRRRLGVLRDEAGVAGFGFVQPGAGPLTAHRATLLAVQIHPERQGRGLGSVLLAGLHRIARSHGVELAIVTYRGGLGLGRFYRRNGYVEFGRLPGALRVAPDDIRDEVWMARWL